MQVIELFEATDKYDIPAVQVIELFKAADKYDVLGLVQECVARFRQLTGADEIAPLLQASHAHLQSERANCLACPGPRKGLIRLQLIALLLIAST